MGNRLFFYDIDQLLHRFIPIFFIQVGDFDLPLFPVGMAHDDVTQQDHQVDVLQVELADPSGRLRGQLQPSYR
ncbi:MAG: hypothetical protein KGY60_07080 [Bacteroidales bacterium]|nr:hypothetical protein [Bacteroidales bacterium]